MSRPNLSSSRPFAMLLGCAVGFATLAACEFEETPCDRWADEVCAACDLDADACAALRATVSDPTADNVNFCEAELANVDDTGTCEDV